MTTAIKRRRGTTTQHSTFTGLEGELTIDTTKDTVVVHDGVTAGGFPLAKETGSAIAATTLSASGAFSANGGATLGDASGDALTINSSAVSIPNGLNFDSNTLVIDATNNEIGIGTNNPLSKLHVSGSDTTVFSVNGATKGIRFDFDSTQSTIYGVDNTFFGSYQPLRIGGSVTIFTYGGAEAMRIDSSGNVGIGTSSPTSFGGGYKTLEVKGSTSTNGGVVRAATSDNSYMIDMYANNSGGNLESRGANPLLFLTNSSERMRLDSSGNLGLGVTPSAWGASGKALQISGNAVWYSNSGGSVSGNNFYYNGSNNIYYSSSYATIYSQTATGQHQWFIAPSGTAGNAITFTQAMTLDASGNLGLGTTSPTGLTRTLRIDSVGGTKGIIISRNNSDRAFWYAEDDGSSVYFGSNLGALAFTTNGAERMRIDSSGNLLVGKTASSANGDGAQLFPSGTVGLGHTSGTVTGTAYAAFGYAGGGIGSITQNGTTAVAYNTSSDYRLKENIAPMTGALAKVAALKPVTYTWKADGSDGQGFIAHELQAVVPECVTGEKDAVNEDGSIKPQGIDTSFLVATLTAAIQEQQAIIADLKSRIETLESK